jgi:NodT family efflux transporter outer membrane factor (OMF) lipoprotein
MPGRFAPVEFTMKKAFFAAALIMFAGCALFQPQTRPSAPLALPEAYSLYTDDAPASAQWWQSFGNTELNELIVEALSANFDIRTAWSRLEQADAVARQAGAALAPSVDYSAGAEKSWMQTKRDDDPTRHSDTQTYSASVAASYELDLWGRLDALRQSEHAELRAAREDLEAAAVTVAAEVVTTWLDILSARRQITILQDQIKLNQSLLKLQQLRFVNGQASALDVAQQREALAAANAKLPLLQLAEQLHLNALAVLLGRSSAQTIAIAQQELPDLIPMPGSGLPADLLAARPDVRAAGLRLKAADWQVSAARADRLPAVSLSAAATFSSDAADLLFSNWVANLAASITGPLLDAGYRSAEVDRTRAVAEEYLADYARTVAEAIREVENSLATEKRQTEYIALLAEQLDAARLALKNARIQYMNGQDNYLDYLIAWTSVQDLDRQLVAERAALIKNRVTLYRTLGGAWTRELIAGAGPAAPADTVIPPSGS